jgi:RimJ/RimL family protein N-acetyltransferase
MTLAPDDIPCVTDPATGLPVGVEVDPRPAIRPDRRVLEGRFVRLEPLDPDRHGRDLWEESHGPGRDAIWTYLFEAPFGDEGAFLAHLRAKAASSDPLFIAVVRQSDGRALGYQTLMRIEPVHRVIEVGNVMYGAGLQRTPASTEAQFLFMRHVFDDLGYRRYEWKCNALNAPSRRAADRLGFTFEGVFRQHMIVRGRNRDTAWYAILDTEWPARRAAFEAWLAPSNFDSEGRQKRSLAALAGRQE